MKKEGYFTFWQLNLIIHPNITKLSSSFGSQIFSHIIDFNILH